MQQVRLQEAYSKRPGFGGPQRVDTSQLPCGFDKAFRLILAWIGIAVIGSNGLCVSTIRHAPRELYREKGKDIKKRETKTGCSEYLAICFICLSSLSGFTCAGHT